MYEFFDTAYYFLLQYIDQHSFLIPLGVIGLWRWSVWLLKEIVALQYRPLKNSHREPTTIVTPVYNENPQIFQKALNSWKKNNPDEIIAVIDYTDKKCIEIFQKFAEANSQAKLIITKKPGKRPALADGIKAASSPIVALVDSDTIWDGDVLKNGLCPFIDKKVAGVGTYQSVLKPKTIAQRIFDTQLDLRYCDEYPFLAASGDALVCLSGRTAFYRREIILPMLPDLVYETFNGQKMISGDDKTLTYLVLSQGWKVAYQNNAHVYTPGMENMSSYLKQRLRWARNSLRADLKALWQGWPFHHPSLVFFQMDKVAQAIVVLLSPLYFLVSLFLHIWTAALAIALWWIVSRSIKMYPHLKKEPKDVVLIPAFILYSFLTGVVKLYAFFTLNTQGWITRWHKKRLPAETLIKTAPAYVTALVIMILGLGIFFYKQSTYVIPREDQKYLLQSVLPYTASVHAQTAKPAVSKSEISSASYTTKKHILGFGETLQSIAFSYDVSYNDLLFANVSRITNQYAVEAGTVLTIPGKSTHIEPSYSFNFQRVYPDFLTVYYEPEGDMIMVSGRGKRITLADIHNAVGDQYLEEVKPKEWVLKSNLYLRSGVTLTLDQNEVTWLKMISNKKKYTYIRALNGVIVINGVKITSWDDTKGNVDTDIKDGRSYLLVKDSSRMDIYHSELAYLGFSRELDPKTSPYGVSWRMSNGKLGSALLTGEITGSKFHHNYFGAYTFGATGMVWRDNQFYSNVHYGLDPHDDSNGFLVENNRAFDNGTHGIIFSKRCKNNIIRNNISYNNRVNGIMLHESSDDNIVEGNTVYGNSDGIVVWRSSGNLIQNNIVSDNKRGIRGNHESVKNKIIGNRVANNTQYGIFLYGAADKNTIAQNTVLGSKTGIYIKTSGNVIEKNRLEKGAIGIFLFDNAAGNLVTDNRMAYFYSYGLYAKLIQGPQNKRGSNSMYRNRKDVFADRYYHPIQYASVVCPNIFLRNDLYSEAEKTSGFGETVETSFPQPTCATKKARPLVSSVLVSYNRL